MVRLRGMPALVRSQPGGRDVVAPEVHEETTERSKGRESEREIGACTPTKVTSSERLGAVGLRREAAKRAMQLAVVGSRESGEAGRGPSKGPMPWGCVRSIAENADWLDVSDARGEAEPEVRLEASPSPGHRGRVTCPKQQDISRS